MKSAFKFSLCALAMTSLVACSKGGGNNNPPAPRVLPPNLQTNQAVCNPSVPGALSNPACANPNLRPGVGPTVNGMAMGTFDIVDPGNGTTVIRSRQFHLVSGYAQESGTDTCYTNPDSQDHTYVQKMRPIGTSALQSVDMVLNFDPNGVLTLQVNSPTGQVQSVAPATYTLDASTSSILIQGFQGTALALAGVPNPSFGSVESVNAYRTAQATDQSVRDEYGMDSNVSSAFAAGPFGPIGANGSLTFDPHFHMGQPMAGQAYPGQTIPGQPVAQAVAGQPNYAGAPMPGIAGQPNTATATATAAHPIPPYTATLANPLNNGMNSLSMTMNSGIIGQIVVSPSNHQHVAAIFIPSMSYAGASVLTLPTSTCQSQSTGQFIKLLMR